MFQSPGVWWHCHRRDASQYQVRPPGQVRECVLDVVPHALRPLMEDLDFGCQYPPSPDPASSHSRLIAQTGLLDGSDSPRPDPILVRQLRLDAFPSEFAGRLLDRDPVSHPRLLARGTPLNCRVVPRPSTARSPLSPLEHPSQPPERLLPLHHEIVAPRAERVAVESRGENVEVRARVAADRIRTGVPPEGGRGSGVVRWIQHAASTHSRTGMSIWPNVTYLRLTLITVPSFNKPFCVY